MQGGSIAVLRETALERLTYLPPPLLVDAIPLELAHDPLADFGDRAPVLDEGLQAEEDDARVREGRLHRVALIVELSLGRKEDRERIVRERVRRWESDRWDVRDGGIGAGGRGRRRRRGGRESGSERRSLR